MELLAPAGNKEKLEVAFHYGADAVYIGGQSFNLRSKSDNFSMEDFAESRKIADKLGKKIYLTLNAYMHEREKKELAQYLAEIKDIKFDGYIVSDLGVLSILKKIIPYAEIHISTQANVLNSESANMYQEMGATRIVLARELTLNEIKEIRDKTDAELEVFVHGAICMSYSGRCLLSNYMNTRDANKGDCSQVCRWKFKTYYIEEESRKGEYIPIEEGHDYATILSSKDLAMARHLDELEEAGVDSIKIEGRMKSVYYVANTVRVYRMLLDTLMKTGRDYNSVLDKEPIRSYLLELEKVSRRESGTGFFFHDKENTAGAQSTMKAYLPSRRLLAMVESVEGKYAKLRLYNTIKTKMPLVYIGKNFIHKEDNLYKLYIKDNENRFIETETLRAIDEAYISATEFNLNKYDIITLDRE